jgi:hypothetical protein
MIQVAYKITNHRQPLRMTPLSYWDNHGRTRWERRWTPLAEEVYREVSSGPGDYIYVWAELHEILSCWR